MFLFAIQNMCYVVNLKLGVVNDLINSEWQLSTVLLLIDCFASWNRLGDTIILSTNFETEILLY